MRVITVANQKGGVGKTTTCITLAGILSDSNKRTLMVDLDPHGSLSNYFSCDKYVNNAEGVYEIFKDIKPLPAASLSKIIQKTTLSNLDILPRSAKLSQITSDIFKKKGTGLILRENLSKIEHKYDYVIVDCPPVIGPLMINALAASQVLVIPTPTDYLGLHGLEQMVTTVELMLKTNKIKLDYIILPTMYDTRTRVSKSVLEDLEKKYPNNVWFPGIPIDTKLKEAYKKHIPTNIYAPRAKSVKTYAMLLHEIVGKFELLEKRTA